MKVVGIDPGTYSLGYGIIEQTREEGLKKLYSGVIKVNKKLSTEKRLSMIYTELNEIIQRFHPDEASVENVFFALNVKTALSLGQVRGVVVLCLTQSNIPIYQYSAAEVKKAITGYGRADKTQVQKMIKQILKLKELPQSDEADALALAICHINTRRFSCLKDFS